MNNNSNYTKMNQLNILCIGELTSDRSAFLSFYTDSDIDEKYKVFVHKEKNNETFLSSQNFKSNEESLIVYLHQIEELEGNDVYLKYPFDAVLFFIKIDAFHNTSKNILDTIQFYSQINGVNVYKIPFRLVALSDKNENYYDDIGYGDKQRLWLEVCSILNGDQIIFVEFDGQFKQKLSLFYKQIIREQALGIKQSAYSNWYLRGVGSFFSTDQLKLNFFKLYGEFQYFIRSRLNSLKRKKQIN